MNQTLLIETVMGQTRLAVIEDGALCELYYERPGMENLANNIYLGRVENVLPGMNAAFVDIGLEKNGFLYAGDIDGSGDTGIEKCVRPGQEILVQVTKSQSGAKGPRLSGQITLPGRLMALLPGEAQVGVSRKIIDEAERNRLRDAGTSLLCQNGLGMILRTAAESAPEPALAKEYAALAELWKRIKSRAEHGIAPKLLHMDNSLALRAARDMLSENVDALWADDEALYAELKALAALYAPQWQERIRLHDGSTPLFDLHRVDAQAEKAMQKYVWLKSGGSLVIEETEALTVVDVNTGKFVGKKDLAETIFKNNCEAAREIMRQLRLRDLGGIIIVDFIDMADETHKQRLLDALREEAARDRNRVNVVGMTALGLVELTRKKLRQPLSRQLLHTCSDCGGNGMVPSHETAARAIEREIWRRRRAGESNPILVEASAPVCGLLKTIGAPEGGSLYVRPAQGLSAGEYRVSPADVNALPNGTKLLK